jgi:5-methylcytosine-specific restriction protein A
MATARFKAQHAFCINAGRIATCTLVTDVTDHIVPHEGDERLFWDELNWQPMCYSCHSRKTASEVSARR